MKSFCPDFQRYAVIQMDPVGMVKHFDDPIALSAAQAMRPRKYLVYLDYPLDLPTPSNPWYRYIVNPIGTTLRPEDSGRGITSDMVIPIYPNTFHPNGDRPPVRTYPPFPFPNCFHWIKSGVTVRVRRKATRYDDTNAYKITFQQRMEIDRTFFPDKMRINAFLRAKQAALEEVEMGGNHSNSVPTPSGVSPEEAHLSDSDVESRIDDDLDSLPEGPEDFDHAEETDDTDPSSPRSVTPSIPQASTSVEALLKMDIFGFEVDDTAELMPLVDLWFDLTDHLTADTIPSPVEFYQEHEEIMRIIHEARERAPSLRAPFLDNGVEIDRDALSSVESMTTAEFLRNEDAMVPPELRVPFVSPLNEESLESPSRPSQRRPHISTTWRTFKRRTAQCLKSIVPWHNRRPPCLPYWC
ncbi:hypothetical protein PYCCODRAFT_1440926 [Trametes coccinea BRFM310]|uniref:Uncharacterized protein n=1 Tax=Trametes coccinea (strain BRFM310) TaxID=1353009 RepID=A0A1Y2I667_TRAC3|nr:hypothetical protein PYCCODRAFT_1440926 [Trametes coccinea BRFM310]